MPYLFRFRIDVHQKPTEAVAQVLVEEQLHAGAVTIRRSRSAA
jgi:hypothetical protein